ncbi:unnamed protein product [Caenorhabditis sp. 36 PRJEB53466]|nr:unnamed protein product [Caenorhabditis sp. 36 PRJEB53466]
MLSSIIRCGGQQASSRMTPAVCMAIRRFDPLEAKMAQKKAEALQQQDSELDQQRVTYATKDDFKQSVQDNRYQGAADAEIGQVPTKLQKRFIVITKLYPSVDAIPPYVHNGTMNRMHDRMRVVFIVVASIFFFSTFYIAERTMAAKIARDRDAGVVVTKIILINAQWAFSWKKEHLTPEQLARTADNNEKYSGIPAIPVDIGFHGGKQIGGAQKTGVISNAASNPGVILGMGLTTAALLGMFKSSFLGDKVGAQKMMQYRIMAQFFTVTALVAGVTIFGGRRLTNVHVDGEYDPEWKPVADAFRLNLEQNWERSGAAFVVHHKGVKVVDIWGGFADRESERKWSRDTLSIAFSCSKAMGAIVIAKLIDEEFGQHGKGNVTVRWLVTHKAGLAYTDHPITLEMAKRPEVIDRILAEQKPNWPPGTAVGYHAVTHGWLLDAIVRRVDGKSRTVGRYFKEEIADKHGIDFFLGLPLSEQHRVSRIENPNGWNVLEEIFYSPKDFDVIRFLKDKWNNGTLAKTTASTPFIQFVGAMTLNDPDLHRLEQSAVLGIGTARAMAEVFELLRKGKIVSEKVKKEMFENYEMSEDYISGAKVPRGQGLMLKSFEQKGEKVNMYGHSGYGGQNIRTDFEHEITISYLSNGLKVGFGDTARTYKRLLETVYDTYLNL